MLKKNWEEVNTSLLNLGDLRLDASYYCEASKSHLKLINYKGKKENLNTFSKKIFYPGRFKRTIVDKEYGKPFFSGAQILEYFPRTNKYLAKNKIPKSENFIVKKEHLLITRSGTIGNTTMPNENLINELVTEHAIRIEINDMNDMAYLYTFLNTSIGKELVNQPIFGSVIDQIEPFHLEEIKVPILSKNLFETICKLITQVRDKRNKGLNYLKKSEMDFYKILDLPEIIKDKNNYINKNINTNAWEIVNWSQRLRLDSSFYDPHAKTTVNILAKKFKNVLENMGEKNNVYELPTYKRIYLDNLSGTPFLSGKNLLQSKFQDIKYLAKNVIKNFEKYLIEENMVLVTMRGTCGRTRLIDKSLNGYGASHNILRLKNSKEYDPGYLFTFLNTDYGLIQVNSKILGSVVDVLTPEDLSDIVIPKIDINKQMIIGKSSKKAFELFSEANSLENEAIDIFEKAL